MHKQFLISKRDINSVKKLIDIYHPEPNNKHLCSLYWIGKDPVSNQDVSQISVFCPENVSTRYLSFDGYAYTIPDRLPALNDRIQFPYDGSCYFMMQGRHHYFNNNDPLYPNFSYKVKKNNSSMIINNASVFDSNYEFGCMFNLRVSFEGDINNNGIDGNIVVLVSIDFPDEH